jgi:hypothetical protein
MAQGQNERREYKHDGEKSIDLSKDKENVCVNSIWKAP